MPARSISRRRFVSQSVLAVGSPMLIPNGVLAADGKPGANERVAIGTIGVGFRASLLMNQLPAAGRIVALCDCNLPRAEKFKAGKKANWFVCQDHHKLLERKDIDAVIVATADFQRVLPCIHACQAGKDVYAEKPLTLYVHEGRVLVSIARKHNRIFQVGSQQRSMALNRAACEFIRGGGLGKLKEVQAVNYAAPLPAPPEPFPEEKAPAGLNWDVWLNQAAMRPFNSKWMGWMFFREFSGGQMTNWGAHGLDQVQWALGADESGPVELWPLTPGRSGQVAMRYANGVEVHIVRDEKTGPMGGAKFIGEKGSIEINRNLFRTNPKPLYDELVAKNHIDVAFEEKKWGDKAGLWQAGPHLQNWLDCIRSRQKPAADVEIGHRSISVCHLANITRECGRRLHWDPAKEQFVGDDAANKLVDRPRRKGYELPNV